MASFIYGNRCNSRQPPVVLAASLIISMAGPALAQPSGQAAQPTADARHQTLAERDRLWAEVQQLEKEGKTADAIEKAHR